VVILPRLARALNAPAVAAVLGLILIAVAIIGLATDDIRTGWAIVILIVGVINLVRTMSSRSAG
jgi:membrane-bound ClpP family serine protease